ncbi:MAG: cob(I)yrinic acid a,c-diamide adenosyltransferase [Candidatus Spechtbacterales bacterium]
MPKPNIGQGDGGESFLFGSGKRFPKDSVQFEVLGTLDELNSAIGYSRALSSTASTKKLLGTIQEHLFEAQSVVGTEPGYEQDKRLPRFPVSRITFLERAIATLEKEAPPLQHFILPGGTHEAAWVHVCRALARRAERRLVTLSREKKINPNVRAYINRLSDVFFVLARVVNAREGIVDTEWKGLKKR